MDQADGTGTVGVVDGLDALRAVSIFEGLDDRALAEIAASIEWQRVGAGEELFGQGDASDGMYLLDRGRLECIADGQLLREIGPGDAVGELALLVGGTRTATVRAVRDSRLGRLSNEVLPALVRSNPDIGLQLARLTARRLISGPPGRTLSGRVRAVAVVPLGRRRGDAGLARRIAAVVGETDSVAEVGSGDLAVWVAGGGRDRVVAELGEREDANELTIVSLGADRFESESPREQEADGSVVALRQMDLVVGVVERGDQVADDALALVQTAGRPLTLVVVHGRATAPQRTGELVGRVGRAVEVRDVVHVRRDRDGDVERLARIVRGRAVGLVLGGGGSRGFAHIGVIRALREAGIPVDRVGGSSMGAIMAGQVALGWSPEEMLERNAAVWSRRQLVELAVPTASLLRGRRANATLEALFGDQQIEDLWVDYFCTTVDLSAFTLHIARRGRLAEWARASATVPGLWPPIVGEDGHLHVDGGVLDNVPTDIMRAGTTSVVIGVDVCNRQSAMTVSDPRPLPTGLALLRARRRSWVPTIFDVLGRANLLAALQTHSRAREHADLFIAPPVEDQGFAAFNRIAALSDAGYRATIEQLEAFDGDQPGALNRLREGLPAG